MECLMTILNVMVNEHGRLTPKVGFVRFTFWVWMEEAFRDFNLAPLVFKDFFFYLGLLNFKAPSN